MSIDRYRKYEPIDGRWYITKELGKGAFGSVFEVERRDFGNARAAMKIITVPQSPAEVESFRQEHYELDDKSVTEYFYGCVENVVKEFQLMGRLKGHSNIVSMEDYNVVAHEDGIGWDIFIRMELLTPMNVYFAQNQITREDAIRLGIDICRALEICEKQNIIHRDIKPGNIFVSDTGEFKLGDFGIARTLERASGELSQKGTYTYMAPEVFSGRVYDGRVDIYSLGIVLYKLFNNNLEPFRTNNTHSDMQDAFARRMNGEIVPAPVNADEYLAQVILKACAFNADERFSTPSEFRVALENALSDNSNWYDNSQANFVRDEDTAVISSTAEKKGKKTNGIKKIAIVSCALVILAVVSIFMIMKTGSGDYAGDTIVYQIADNMTDEEKLLTKEIVEARLEPFGKAVKLKTGENIEVLLGEKEVLGENYRERRYNFNMLISKGDLRIAGRRTTNLSSFGKEAIESAKLEVEPKEKFQTLLDDKMNDVVRDMVDNSEGENVYYIHVKLTPNAAIYYKEMIDKFAENPYSYGAVVTNVTSEDKATMDYDEVGYTIDITNDGSEFYILPEYFESEVSATLLYNMIMADKLPDTVKAVLDNKTDWETDEKSFGKYQIHNTKGKLAGINIFLHDFDNKYEEDEATEDFNTLVKTIKNRMDALETEYIIGYNGIDNRDIMLKFSPDKVSAQIINMVINDRNVSVSSTFKTLAVDKKWIDIYSVEPVIDNGKVCLKVEISATNDELLTASAGDENFYLTVNGYTVAKANINEIKDGVIMFKDFLIFDEKEATDSEIHILNMISEIFEEKWAATPSVEDTVFAYCEDGESWKLTNDIPWKYSALNYRDKNISKIVSEYGHKMTKPVTTNTSLNVILNIDEDENFAEKLVEEVKKVYSACGFDSGEYHSVMFVVDGETKKNSSNRARFFVSRVYDWPSMKIEASFKGPNYEEYADEIEAICQSDEFFTMRSFGMY